MTTWNVASRVQRGEPVRARVYRCTRSGVRRLTTAATHRSLRWTGKMPIPLCGGYPPESAVLRRRLPTGVHRLTSAATPGGRRLMTAATRRSPPSHDGGYHAGVRLLTSAATPGGRDGQARCLSYFAAAARPTGHCYFWRTFFPLWGGGDSARKQRYLSRVATRRCILTPWTRPRDDGRTGDSYEP